MQHHSAARELRMEQMLVDFRATAGGWLKQSQKTLQSSLSSCPPRLQSQAHVQKSFWGSFPMPSALGPRVKPGFPLHHILPACLENSRDAEEAKVRDHNLPVVIENIFGLEIFVEDSFGMQVPHALGWRREKNRADKEAQRNWITEKRGSFTNVC